MLRKAAGISTASVSSTSTYDDDKKSSKVQRQSKERAKSTLLFLLMIGVLCCGALYTFQDSTDFDPFGPGGLRASANRVLKKKLPKLPLKNPSLLPPDSIYQLSVDDCDGNKVSLDQFSGSVALVVNVASHWGKTEVSYTQLAQLQEKYQDRGFTVLAFPTNDFHQEPGSNEQILGFVKESFPQVTFPIFGKQSLAENPVYQRFERHLPNDVVKHNFFKYLVNRQGIAVKMFDKKQEPLSLQEEIEKLLEEDVPKKMTTE